MKIARLIQSLMKPGVHWEFLRNVLPSSAKKTIGGDRLDRPVRADLILRCSIGPAAATHHRFSTPPTNSGLKSGTMFLSNIIKTRKANMSRWPRSEERRVGKECRAG